MMPRLAITFVLGLASVGCTLSRATEAPSVPSADTTARNGVPPASVATADADAAPRTLWSTAAECARGCADVNQERQGRLGERRRWLWITFLPVVIVLAIVLF